MITIGVLGGIGPEATGIFYLKLIARLQQEGLVRRNEDFPRIIINSIPAPELVREQVSEEDLAPYYEGLNVLDRVKPDAIVMVCNTIHLFYDGLQQRIKSPILNLPLAVEENLRKKNIRCAGILATQMTIKQGLYKCKGVELLAPNEQEMQMLMQAVVTYNKGYEKELAIAQASVSVENLIRNGAECVILGCTEFAAMLQEKDLPIIDTIDVLVHVTVERFRELKKNEIKKGV